MHQRRLQSHLTLCVSCSSGWPVGGLHPQSLGPEHTKGKGPRCCLCHPTTHFIGLHAQWQHGAPLAFRSSWCHPTTYLRHLTCCTANKTRTKQNCDLLCSPLQTSHNLFLHAAPSTQVPSRNTGENPWPWPFLCPCSYPGKASCQLAWVLHPVPPHHYCLNLCPWTLEENCCNSSLSLWRVVAWCGHSLWLPIRLETSTCCCPPHPPAHPWASIHENTCCLF